MILNYVAAFGLISIGLFGAIYTKSFKKAIRGSIIIGVGVTMLFVLVAFKNSISQSNMLLNLKNLLPSVDPVPLGFAVIFIIFVIIFILMALNINSMDEGISQKGEKQ
ncbi:MAG TPA: hypothetical protein VIK72_14330 [Clostridiaceae bacterium]